MKKSLIVAMTPSGVIGKDGQLPWPHIPGDLPRFKRLTMGKPCIMGRKTFESLQKPLHGRRNIVVSRDPRFAPTGATVVNNILEAWIRADECGADEAFIIGGGEVYRQSFPSCDRLYLTLLANEFNGDTRFQLGDLTDWTIIEHQYSTDSVPHQFLVLERDQQMSQFLTIERLSDNQLPMPRYATPLSAGLDFAACLTRACKEVRAGDGHKTEFWADSEGTRNYFSKSHKAEDLVLQILPGETILVPLGFKCSFSPCCVFNLYPRSSVGLKGIVLANGTGIVDPDYRGELFAALTNRTNVAITIKHGERVIQGILTYFAQGIVSEGVVDETVRGENGLGSTGQMAEELMSANEIKQAVAAGLPLG